jgi:hypothetical protein
VKLKHAARRVARLIDDQSLGLAPEDRVALHVLVELSKRVERVQKPLRQLHRALCPEEDMNQTQLFSED